VTPVIRRSGPEEFKIKHGAVDGEVGCAGTSSLETLDLGCVKTYRRPMAIEWTTLQIAFRCVKILKCMRGSTLKRGTMANGKDSAEVIKFLNLLAQLKNCCDDDPECYPNSPREMKGLRTFVCNSQRLLPSLE
jgi:hypothetical protein